MLSREAIEEALARWFGAWNEHDLDEVMELFHDEVLFEHWTGARVRGKKSLRRAWTPWFADHNGFRFVAEDTFIDVSEQKALCRWLLEWKPPGKETEEGLERRRGVDVLHFSGRQIVEKLTYSKTAVEN
jgi:ketosteroid isomerase-like protein